MKKFTAILLTLIVILSTVSVIAAAADSYVCDFCDQTFSSYEALKAHIDASFPVRGHITECGNELDKNLDGVIDPETEVCHEVFTTKIALAAHQETCKFVDKRTDSEKMIDAFKAGQFSVAFGLLGKMISGIVSSDDFKKTVDKVIESFKAIDFSKIISTIKGFIDQIAGLIK